MSGPDIGLASGFAAASVEAWKKAVATALKGKPFDVLVSRSADGIAIEPLYSRVAGAPVAGRPGAAPWTVVTRVDHPVPAAANALALEDLAGGASGLALVFKGAPTAYGAGLVAPTLADLDRALADVMLDVISLRVEAGGAQPAAVAMLLALAEKRGIDPATLDLSAGLDPLGIFAATGKFAASWAETAPRFAGTAATFARRGLKGPVALADARPWAGAGATEVQELAAALATGVAYLRALGDADADLADAAGRIAFALSYDADQFLGVAKTRALRRLWARVRETLGLSTDVPAVIHGETAWRMTTSIDPWVNMLRATVATFAAGVGGVDSLAVLPFTQSLGVPDAFARRVARNTQLILLEESHLARVVDPAAGSGAIESLTETLAAEAWDLFRAIEAEGGIEAAILSGSLAGKVATAAAARRAGIAKRKIPLTGTSEFPNVTEAPVAVAEVGAVPAEPTPTAVSLASYDDMIAAMAAGASLADIGRAVVVGDGVSAAALPSIRISADFEALRAAAAKAGSPKVFLAALGSIATNTARATWAKNFYEAGGVVAITNDGFKTAEEAAAAFTASGAKIACICSSDAVYAELAEPTAKALKAAGAILVHLAGRPGDAEAAYKAAGVDGFVSVGADVVAVLTDVQKTLGIAA